MDNYYIQGISHHSKEEGCHLQNLSTSKHYILLTVSKRNWLRKEGGPPLYAALAKTDYVIVRNSTRKYRKIFAIVLEQVQNMSNNGTVKKQVIFPSYCCVTMNIVILYFALTMYVPRNA